MHGVTLRDSDAWCNTLLGCIVQHVTRKCVATRDSEMCAETHPSKAPGLRGVRGLRGGERSYADLSGVWRSLAEIRGVERVTKRS